VVGLACGEGAVCELFGGGGSTSAIHGFTICRSTSTNLFECESLITRGFLM